MATLPQPRAEAAPVAAPAVLAARGVYKIFVSGRPRRAITALRDISLEVRAGEFLALIGPSGCGKSTLLNMFAGLVTPTDGAVLHDGRPVRGVNTRVGYVTQDDNLLPWRTALANVEIALELKGVPPAERRARALAGLARVGLRGFEHHYPHELSGGMRKRVSIVRTIVDETVNVVLMDEPFGPLDAQTRLVLKDELLQLWQGSGRTVVFVTHDLVEAIALADRIAIFTRAPGTIKAVRPVPIPRPRDVFHIHEAPGFAPVYDAIWEDLREEITGRRPGDGDG
ncbi:MAG: ABC transporter ATP-binding protein [Armatimonadota bacterium]|nr:ABC transporter ATP-binding protein [Armatimonadota bacterium]